MDETEGGGTVGPKCPKTWIQVATGLSYIIMV